MYIIGRVCAEDAARTLGGRSTRAVRRRRRSCYK